ncbi:filament-like plant protein 4 isoform X1 [Cryptomeria japonica]|uniref:filament-like plant protein 4 isoform X1 n=1 Tax=Cryptomeria japonica TaxID=3369 RepID=UPI0027DA345F|nr:filament-like plant protein 4 isoform X1 [Cryptomeria japonica]XP_057833797.2 filament-like plant protein 4 isoform X1 [Cryptomeria japonica]
MDGRSWPWRRKSSDKVGGSIGSSESSPGHSTNYSDDQDTSKAGADHLQMSDDTMMACQVSEERLKSLNEKLSQALLDNTVKDNLVKQHAKVAEEAVSGWEKAEKEAMALKQQFDTVTQQKLALEDRVSHLDGALKECMRELRNAREEQEQKLHEAMVKKTREWDKSKFELDSRIVELEQLLYEAEAKNNTASTSLQENSKALSDLQEARNQIVSEAKVLQTKLEMLESENGGLKYKLHALNKEVGMIIDERDITKKSAQAASKQHIDTVKKVTKLEAECQRLRGLLKKRLPGPATLAQVKLEVDTAGRESGDIRLRKSLSKGAGSPRSSVETLNDKHQEHSQRAIDYHTGKVLAIEEENKMLKDALSKQNSELKASRVMCARKAAKLSTVEQQLDYFRRRQGKPALELHLEGSRSESTSNPPSLSSISEDGNDGDPICAESWASALIVELDHIKIEKVTGKVEKLSDVPKVDLMDDFLEMERLASMDSTGIDQAGIGKLDELTDKNVPGSFGILPIQEDRALLEEALAQKESKLQAVNQECSELLKKQNVLQENLTVLQARNTWNESALVSLKEKLDIILAADAEGADLHKILDEVKCAMTIDAESARDSQTCVWSSVKADFTSLSDTGSRISAIDVEFATAVASVVNFLQSIAQDPEKTPKFKASDTDKLVVRIQEFAQLVDHFLRCKANITELIVELISLLSQFRKMFALDSSEILQNEATDFDNQLPNLMQSSFLRNLISTDILSRQESAQGPSGEEKANSLRFQLAGGNLYIIRKLNRIQVEKTSLESELKAQVSRLGDLEEELMCVMSENANLETVLAATKENLGHAEHQLTELMRVKSENANLETVLAATKENLGHAEHQLTELKEELICIKSEDANLEIALTGTKEKLDHTQYQLTELKEELLHLRSENANLEAVLAATKEKLENTENQLTKSEQMLANLQVQLESAKESKQLLENELAAMISHKSNIESQFKATETEMKGLSEKVDALELELQEERMQCKDAITKCEVLQEHLQRKERFSEYSKNSVSEEDEIRKRQEMYKAAAAGKFAECQKTILVLSRQLKALASPVDSLEFSYDTEKRAERDQAFELDSPWSHHSQTASWASEVEISSTLTGREVTRQWTGESVRIAPDIYKGNTLDAHSHADYIDGQFTMLSSSDTEENSPTRSPTKSGTLRNRSFLEGNEFSKPVNVTGGESPTSSSSSSSLASAFFSKEHN